MTAEGDTSLADSRARKSWRDWRSALLLLVVLIALGVALFWRGAEFYRLDLASRVGHRDFRSLSPGGPIGHGYGIAGTALIFTNLLYLARRRFARWHLGSMRAWLSLHVLTGLFGSVLVVFPSAFQLRSPVATLTSISLAFVVVSGLIGRYFYGLAPQPDLAALARNMDLLARLNPEIARRLQAALGALPPASEPRRATLLDALGTIPRWLREVRAREHLVREQCAPLLDAPQLDRAQRSQVRTFVRRTARLSSESVRAVAGGSLLRSWRGLHRFMAVLMILSVTGHIVVAWVFGFRWIFSD